MIRKDWFKSNSNLILRRDEGNMQVWPPKELPIIKMTDDMLISGVSIREFEAILKTGFSKMYAETRSRITPPIETRAISNRTPLQVGAGDWKESRRRTASAVCHLRGAKR